MVHPSLVVSARSGESQVAFVVVAADDAADDAADAVAAAVAAALGARAKGRSDDSASA